MGSRSDKGLADLQELICFPFLTSPHSVSICASVSHVPETFRPGPRAHVFWVNDFHVDNFRMGNRRILCHEKTGLGIDVAHP